MERLKDPEEHYPYKYDTVVDLLDENPACGPKGENDRSMEFTDFMSTDIAEASDAMISAQAAYVSSPSDSNKSTYETAKAALVLARQEHRANRTNTDGSPAMAVIGFKGVQK